MPRIQGAERIRRPRRTGRRWQRRPAHGLRRTGGRPERSRGWHQCGRAAVGRTRRAAQPATRPSARACQRRVVRHRRRRFPRRHARRQRRVPGGLRLGRLHRLGQSGWDGVARCVVGYRLQQAGVAWETEETPQAQEAREAETAEAKTRTSGAQAGLRWWQGEIDILVRVSVRRSLFRPRDTLLPGSRITRPDPRRSRIKSGTGSASGVGTCARCHRQLANAHSHPPVANPGNSVMPPST